MRKSKAVSGLPKGQSSGVRHNKKQPVPERKGLLIQLIRRLIFLVVHLF